MPLAIVTIVLGTIWLMLISNAMRFEVIQIAGLKPSRLTAYFQASGARVGLPYTSSRRSVSTAV